MKTIFKNLQNHPWILNEKNPFDKIIKNICLFSQDNVPKTIRIILISIVISTMFLVIKLFTIICQIVLPIYTINGKDKYTGKNIKILYIGNKINLNYISNLLISKELNINKIGKTFLWNIDKHLKFSSPNIDAAFIKIDRFYSRFIKKKGFIVIPEWISMSLDITPPLLEIKNKFNISVRRNIKKIKKNGYTYEISNDPDKLEFFYKKMYLPYITERYGKSAFYHDLYFMRYLFDRGTLLLVKDENQYILGLLLRFINKKNVMITHMGVLEGNIKLLKKGSRYASTYFSIKWAKEHEFKNLHFGFCKGFLNDGVLQYNAQWGTNIRNSESKMTGSKYNGILGFKLIKNKKSIKSFLINSPFIYSDNNLLKGMIFLEKNNAEIKKEIRHIVKTYFISGITTLTVIFSNQIKNVLSNITLK